MTELRTVTLRGRVGTDIIVTTTPRGHVCARFRLAVGQWRVDDNGEFQETGTNWYTIKAWDTLAENVRSSVLKGQKIIVVGKPVAEAWLDRNHQARGELVIVAASIGHDLTAGPSRALMVQTPKGDSSRPPASTHEGGTTPNQGATMTHGPADGDQHWHSAPPGEGSTPDKGVDTYGTTPAINAAGTAPMSEGASAPNREYVTDPPAPPEEDYPEDGYAPDSEEAAAGEDREPALSGAGAFAGAYDT